MNINKISNREIVKTLLLKELITQIELVEMLNKKYGRKYGRSSFGNKYKANSFRFDEMQEIFEVLGYDLDLTKKS